MKQATQQKLLGRVQKVIPTKGNKAFGFIVTDDWLKFFFHSDDVENRLIPEESSMVEFQPLRATAKGLRDRAVHIRIVSVPG